MWYVSIREGPLEPVGPFATDEEAVRWTKAHIGPRLDESSRYQIANWNIVRLISPEEYERGEYLR